MAQGLNTFNDEELVIQYRSSHNKECIGELFKRHTLLCFAVCHTYLKDEMAAQDAVMGIFEKLFEELKKHQISNFRSWLHTVCRNYCLMQLRKIEYKQKSNTFNMEELDAFMELENFVHPTLDESKDTEKKLTKLELALENLKDKQRLCIELFYLQQKSYDEIGSITGFSNNEVKSHIQNGKRNLKILLEGEKLAIWIGIILWQSYIA